MSLGYETYEDNRDFEQAGLTGEVRRYTTTKMEYPCYILCSTERNPIKLHSVATLKKMFPSLKVYDESVASSLIHVYFNQGSQTAKLGMIMPNQVKTFLKLFEGYCIEGYMNKDKPLKGMYLYVLAE